MNLPKVKMLQVSKCLIGLAVMMLQSCDVADNRRDMLCGNWESVVMFTTFFSSVNTSLLSSSSFV